MFMRSTLAWLLAMCLLLVQTDYLRAHGKELELGSILDLRVIENTEGNEVRITGLCGESAWHVKKVTTKKKGHAVLVKILLGFVELPSSLRGAKNLSGSFDVKVRVTPDIDWIVLGKSIVWQRGKASPNTVSEE